MIYDISPLIDERIAVWPGDTNFSRAWQCQIKDGSNIDLSTITTTVHIGAHADAPSHFHSDGVTIDRVAIEPYWGPCTVITVRRRPLIMPEDVAPALAKGARRILVRTDTQPDRTVFPTDFSAFSPEAVRAMGAAGVVLIGIDTASVDPFSSKALPAHQELYRCNIRNLEGLSLEHVPDGEYELVAIPLKLAGGDASPVRAVLRTR